MPQVPNIDFIVNYDGKNITDDISRYLSKLRYKDSTKGQADELELILDDGEGKWRNEWYPQKRDKISARISAGGPFLDCGNFEIDEIEFDFPPDIITIRGLATGVTKKLRTKHHRGHESKTLKQIAQSVCDAHGFTLDTGTHVVTKKKEVQSDIDAIELIKSDVYEVRDLETLEEAGKALKLVGPKVGATSKNLRKKDLSTEAEMMEEGFRWLARRYYTAPALDYYINRLAQVQSRLSPYLQKTEKMVVANDLSSIIVGRSTQNGETDLAYLSRISAEYGFYFNIKGDTMIFYQVYGLEGRSPSITLSKSQLSKCTIKDTSVGTVKSATVTSHNPQTNEVITATAEPEPLFPLQAVNAPYRQTGIGVLKDGKSKTSSSVTVIEAGGTAQATQDPNEVTAEDTVEIKTKAENKQQAEAKAKSALHKANKKAVSGSFTTELNVRLVSGNNVKLEGLGELSGIYHIESAEFEIERRGGATVTCEVYRVGKVDKSAKKV